MAPDAYLPANSAGVAARLCSDGAFWLRRSGFLLRLGGAGVSRGGGDGLAWRARGSVGHGELRRGEGRGVLVDGRRVGRRVLAKVDRGRDEMRGERRWRRRLRYMYSGRPLLNRARAVFCQRLRAVHTRRLNFDSGPRRRSPLIYLAITAHPSPQERLSGSNPIGRPLCPATWENLDAHGTSIAPRAANRIPGWAKTPDRLRPPVRALLFVCVRAPRPSPAAVFRACAASTAPTAGPITLTRRSPRGPSFAESLGRSQGRAQPPRSKRRHCVRHPSNSGTSRA